VALSRKGLRTQSGESSALSHRRRRTIPGFTPPTEAPGPTPEIVLIAGDSGPPSNDEEMFGADGSYAPGSTDSPPPPQSSGGGNAFIWRVLVVVVVAAAAAAVVFFVFTSGTSRSASSTASHTSATVPPALQDDITLSVGVGLISGPPPDNQPILFTVSAAPNAPGVQTVELAFSGPGVPPSKTVTVTPGSSVTDTLMVGCGQWTVQVVSDDGKAVNAAGNPALQNGWVHNCSGQ